MSPHRFSHPLSFLLAAGLAATATAQITPGNLCVMRAGDGAAPLTSASTAAFLDEFDRFTPAQPLPLQTLAMPTAPVGLNLPSTISGTATSEGFITQTADGNYLLAVGYGVAPGTANISGSTSAAANRIVARIALNGTVDTTTALTDAHNAGNIRSAVSVDGSSFWTSGAGNTTAGTNRGMTYVAGLGATTSIQVPATLTNGRVAGIFDNQLYVSTAAGGTFGVVAMGTGLPTTSGQTSTLLNGMATATGTGTISQYDFWFADAQTLYVADDRSMANGGGIQKWIDIAGTWTWQYTLSPGSGCRSVSGIRDLSGTTLYATTATTGPTVPNTLVSIIDDGVSPFVTLATAPADTQFRGVRFVRTPYVKAFGGPGCTTSAGIPTIDTAGGNPISGNANFGIAIGNTPPFSLYATVVSIGTLLDPIGFPLSFIGGPPCAFLFTPTLDILLTGVTDGLGDGVTALGLGIPDSSLWGLNLPVQHLVFDFVLYSGFSLPIGSSTGMQIVIGS